jgi:hypothetical protein
VNIGKQTGAVVTNKRLVRLVGTTFFHISRNPMSRTPPINQYFPSLTWGKTLQLSYHKLEHATSEDLKSPFCVRGNRRPRYRRGPFEVAVRQFLHSLIVRAGFHIHVPRSKLQLNCCRSRHNRFRSHVGSLVQGPKRGGPDVALGALGFSGMGCVRRVPHCCHPPPRDR